MLRDHHLGSPRAGGVSPAEGSRKQCHHHSLERTFECQFLQITHDEPEKWHSPRPKAVFSFIGDAPCSTTQVIHKLPNTGQCSCSQRGWGRCRRQSPWQRWDGTRKWQNCLQCTPLRNTEVESAWRSVQVKDGGIEATPEDLGDPAQECVFQ